MASPSGNAWMAAPAGQQLPGAISASEAEEMGLQVRTMGLKVHYTFDKDSRVNCLARWPQQLQVQAIPISDVSWIGVIDLRTCLQAIAQCSPEILSQNEHDYTIYAYDYSEPDTPLVGQGMLSWALDLSGPPASTDDGSKMVTGRVSKNVLAIFGNGVRETLEVKLKLTEVPRPTRSDMLGPADGSQTRGAPTPTDTTEWNSFLQSNPNLGRSANVAAVQSPGLASVRPDMSYFQQQRPPSAASRPGSRPGSRQSSMPPSLLAKPAHPLPVSRMGSMGTGSPPPTAGTVDEPVAASTPPAEPVKLRSDAGRRPSSRPSSRTRSKVPTGRPRGRPRKQQPADGNTSAAEEQPTDQDPDDGSKRKRVKTTKANYPTKTSLDMPPDSLRVAASTSGSLRTLRPIMAAPPSGNEGGGAGGPAAHLQELPRAPTPVPQGVPPSQHHVRKMLAQKSRRESMVDLERNAFREQEGLYSRSAADTRSIDTRSVDGRSPTESIAPSPENYTPDDSPAEIGSSPPVPRSTTYVPQSSPMPSSPILPPMPRRPDTDSGFMSGSMDDMFDDDDCLNETVIQPPVQTPKEFAAPTPSTAAPEPAANTAPGSFTATNAAPASNAAASQPPPSREGASRPAEQYSFMAINPGPPELLPMTSIYDPPKARPPKAQKAASVGGKSSSASQKRAYSEPAQPQQPQEQHGMSFDASHCPNAQSATSMGWQTTPTEVNTPTPTEVATPMPPTTAGSQGPDVAEDLADLARLIAAEDDLDAAVGATLQMAAANGSSSNDGQMMSQLRLPQSMPQRLPEFFSRAARDSMTSASAGPSVPASDPPAPLPLALPAMPPAPTAFSEAPCPPSDTDQPRSNKNLVRKAAIRERLQKAIESGEMPPFCQNCGAIETPTWRKMWTQDHEGEPGYHEYSEKPGHVTAIDVLNRDDDGKPTKHRLVKKALGPTEDSKQWTQMLLCNPCGIWLGKFKSHRPSDRWEKDASRLNQPKRKRDAKSGGGGSRSRKSRTKSDPQLQPTSEAYFTTDPAGLAELDEINIQGTLPSAYMPTARSAAAEPRSMDEVVAAASAMATELTEATAETRRREQRQQQHQPDFDAGSNRGPASGGGSVGRQGLRSAQSKGSGTAKSPIAVDDPIFGATRRLLFPSPRKDGMPKVLGELDANIGTPTGGAKTLASKLGNGGSGDGESISTRQSKDEMVDLFGTPPPPATRPSTPPPRLIVAGDGSSATASSGPFKTPTRPTPSHRPMTRSITKSIRSVAHCPLSPSEALTALQRTPSKTPRAALAGSNMRRPTGATPGRQNMHNQHGGSFQLCDMTFDTPFTSTLNQLLSEANEFTTGSPSHGLGELDLVSLGSLDGEEMHGGTYHGSVGNIDFSSYLDTDLTMPSTSPLLGRKSAGHSNRHHQVTFGGALTVDSDALWTDFSGAGFPNDPMEEDV
ncbi:gata transcription factor [Grosmannia clavigera kw1407]|uniref:Gata transcription factor n=1 Tax=Grosmannia clavigera (strain kw1407 / UAMH 11150) TaxID=655863 RepID=F0XEA0_GROCL|nr:gata transcription factor [Grosmannia clavigera kw1407]EFX04554.1 gata transcription factor [Grosmannia clavigera kw1407]